MKLAQCFNLDQPKDERWEIKKLSSEPITVWDKIQANKNHEIMSACARVFNSYQPYNIVINISADKCLAYAQHAKQKKDEISSRFLS